MSLLLPGVVVIGDDVRDNLVSTAVFLVMLSIVRMLMSGVLKRHEFGDAETRRRWIVTHRNVQVLVLFVGLVVIWAFELKALALSAVAIGMMAFVVGTKELLVCLIGGVYLAVTRPFKVGDRIEVNGFRGDVVDKSILSTSILEIGPKDIVHQYTGERIVLPNSVFMTHPVHNETFDDKYRFHVFKVPVKADSDWRAAESALLEAANAECAPYIEDARRRMDDLKSSQGIETPTVEPRVWVNCPSPDEIDLYVRIPTPADRKGRLEQNILRAWLAGRNPA